MKLEETFTWKFNTNLKSSKTFLLSATRLHLSLQLTRYTFRDWVSKLSASGWELENPLESFKKFYSGRFWVSRICIFKKLHRWYTHDCYRSSLFFSSLFLFFLLSLPSSHFAFLWLCFGTTLNTVTNKGLRAVEKQTIAFKLGQSHWKYAIISVFFVVVVIENINKCYLKDSNQV